MPLVVFTANLRRLIDAPAREVADVASVREALDQVFSLQPPLRSYILDDQSRVRQHVMIFVDGQPLVDRERQSDAVRADSEIYVMQALSGG